MERVLVIKKESNKNNLSVKVRKKQTRQFAPDDYFKIVNPNDYNDVALLFEDLAIGFNVPIEKAFRQFKQRQNNKFPFY